MGMKRKSKCLTLVPSPAHAYRIVALFWGVLPQLLKDLLGEVFTLESSGCSGAGFHQLPCYLETLGREWPSTLHSTQSKKPTENPRESGHPPYTQHSQRNRQKNVTHLKSSLSRSDDVWPTFIRISTSSLYCRTDCTITEARTGTIVRESFFLLMR